MTKTEQLDELFKEWENSDPEFKGVFFKDGIINEDKYLAAKPRILIITKEPNQGDKPEKGDFREIWPNRIDISFSYRIAEWMHGIQNDFPPFNSVYKNHTAQRSALDQIAIMEVKKIGGGSKSDDKQIQRYIKRDKDFLMRELEIIDPDIIISSLVHKSTLEALFGPNRIDWVDSEYVRSVFNWRGKKVIDFYHPSFQTVPAASYSLLQNIVQSKAFKEL